MTVCSTIKDYRHGDGQPSRNCRFPDSYPVPMACEPHIAEKQSERSILSRVKLTRKQSLALNSRQYQSWFGSACLILALSISTAAQSIKVANKPAPSPATNLTPAIVDPLGRSTPRGTITAFIRAAHRDDYVSAARFMQLSAKQRPHVEVLVQDLKELMDRYFGQPITAISDLPSGELDDGLPLDQERVGPLTMGGGNVYILLVRVNDPDNGQIWLISSETLDQVLAWYGAIEKTWIEQVMPAPLLDYKFLGIPVAKWITWSASLGLPLLIFWLLTRITLSLLKRIIGDSRRRLWIVAWFAGSRWPLTLLLTLATHLIALRDLGFSLSFRIIYSRVGLVVLVIVLTWLIERTSTLAFARARSMMERRRSASTESLIMLGERVFKVVIVLAAILVILSIIGIDTKTALAGVGIGGVAVALGAQKSVENLLGGIFLLSDKTLAVGDMCRIFDRQGWVEDITLRSIRLRTLEQTLLSIPAGTLSQANIENFATRHKILVQTNLLLRYGTNVEQLQFVLENVRKLFAVNAKIEHETSRVRLINFGVRAIELELYAYVLTADYMEFLAIRESLLMQIAGIVEESGSAFAQPTEFVYMSSEQQGASGIRYMIPKDDSRARQEATDAKTGLNAMKERAG